MPDGMRSKYEGADLRVVRAYLIVGDASAAIEFYRDVFDANELERHTTPSGGVGHAKLQIGETIVELGEHPDAASRDAERLPRVGLRVYVADVDATYARAIAAGATGDPPADRTQQGFRGASIYDPFGITWWLAAKLP
jgi:PhnB protein